MISTIAARQSYRRFELFGVALISKEDNSSDDLSKVNDKGKLEHLMKIGIDATLVQQ